MSDESSLATKSDQSQVEKMDSTLKKPNTNYIANQPYNQTNGYQRHGAILQPADLGPQGTTLRVACRPFHLTTLKYGNPQFLRAISITPLQPVDYMRGKYDWVYEKRQRAQAILPYLYLGPASIARDPKFLSENDISMVIAVRSAQSARSRPRWLDPAQFSACKGLQTATFDVDGPFDVIQHIQPMIKTITDHLELYSQQTQVAGYDDVKGRIMIFCESGNDRSPVLVAAYLMLLYGLTWDQSLNFIHCHRFSVSLTGHMHEMLVTFAGIVKAEGDVAGADAGSDTSMLLCERRNKRTLDDAYDSDDTMTDDNEADMRLGVSPFVDAA